MKLTGPPTLGGRQVWPTEHVVTWNGGPKTRLLPTVFLGSRSLGEGPECCTERAAALDGPLKVPGMLVSLCEVRDLSAAHGWKTWTRTTDRPRCSCWNRASCRHVQSMVGREDLRKREERGRSPNLPGCIDRRGKNRAVRPSQRKIRVSYFHGKEMTTTLFIIFIASYVAFSISAVCGGGAGLMLIPLLGQLLPISQVPAALSIGTFSSSTSRLIVFRKNICWHIVKYFVPTALPAVWLGAWLLQYVNPIYLEIAMGIFLFGNLTLLFKRPKELNEKVVPSNFVLGLIGFIAGFLSGLTGAVGLLFNRFYLRYGLTNEEVVATRAANEVILHLVKIVLYSLFGLIAMQVVSVGIAVAISAILSAWTMKWILPRLSLTSFKKIGYSAMVLSGVLLLSASGSHLLTANHNPLTPL